MEPAWYNVDDKSVEDIERYDYADLEESYIYIDNIIKNESW